MLEINKIYHIDVLKGLKNINDNSIDMVITSPPYNKRGLMMGKKPSGGDWNGYITYDNYDDNMPEDLYQKWQINILNEIKRVLKPRGSFFYNHKNRKYNKKEYSPLEWIYKSDLNLYQTIIWNRRRDVNNSIYFFQPVYESIYWLTKNNDKSPKFFKNKSIHKKSIWEIPPNLNLPHPAPFPDGLVEQCVLSTTEIGDLILDPFIGIGTTAVVSKKLKRNYIGFDISQKYIDIANYNINDGKINKNKNKQNINL